MFFFVSWTTHTAFRYQSVIRRVVCEKCSHEYFYELVRGGAGSSSTLYNMNNSGAQDKAASTAKNELQSRLQTGHDPVPCPKCLHIQEPARREAARTRARRWIGPAFLVLIILDLVIPSLLGIVHMIGEVNIPAFLWWSLLSLNILAISGIIYVYLQRKKYDEANFRLISADDPRLLYPPVLQPGTGSNGQQVFAPVTSAAPKVSGLTMFARFVLHPLPREKCLICLEPTDHLHVPFLGQTIYDSKYPCCKSCSRSLNTKAWLSMLATLVVTGLVCWFLPKFTKADAFGRGFMSILMMLVLGLTVIFTFRSLAARVLKFGSGDGPRGWVGLRLRNSKVLSYLVELYSQPEKHTLPCSPEMLQKLREPEASRG